MDFVHKRQKIVNWKYYTRPFIRNIFTYLTEKCEKMLTYTEDIQGGMKNEDMHKKYIIYKWKSETL